MRRKFFYSITVAVATLCVSSCSDANNSAQSQSVTTQVAEIAEGETSFTAQVWADNWFAMYVNGELVGEDSVPITTERSFNQETFTFTADYPLTISLEAKDFKENESGLEYIGQNNQQMGDGGLIAQIIDDSTGEVIAVTDDNWQMFIQSIAPLDKSCENSADPLSDCESQENEIDSDWISSDFDDSDWDQAVVWSEAEVGPKDGYDEVSWDSAAKLIWGTDLEQDNTVLFRTTLER